MLDLVTPLYVLTSAAFAGRFINARMTKGAKDAPKSPNYHEGWERDWGWTLITYALEHTFVVIILALLPFVMVIAGGLVPMTPLHIALTLGYPVFILICVILTLIGDSWASNWGDESRDTAVSARLLKWNSQKEEKKWEGRRLPIDEACQLLLDRKLEFNDYMEVFLHRYDLFKFVITWRHVGWFWTNILGKAVGHDHSSDLADITGVYNRGNDFYHLFMGDTMLYSSGIFHNDQEDLKTAQGRKLDTIANICQIKKGTKHLDLGCGWGTLLAYFAEKGCDSRGITLSGQQAKFCRARVEAAGVSDTAKIDVMNFWDIDYSEDCEKYDVITCLEMSEHIGIAHYSKFMQRVRKLLKDDGVFYLQIAGLRRAWQYEDLVWGLFMGKYIFPGADASCPLAWVIQQCERAGFELRRGHNLGFHYGLTIQRWLERWVENEEEVVQKYGEWWFRLWGIFLAWSTCIAKQGSSTVWFLSLRKNLRADFDSVSHLNGVPLISRNKTDVGPHKLGMESGNDSSKDKFPWNYEGCSVFDTADTHIDSQRNLKVNDDVHNDQERPYTIKEQFFLTLIYAMTGLGFYTVWRLFSMSNENAARFFKLSLTFVMMVSFLVTRWSFVWLSRPLVHKFARGFDNTRTVHQMAHHAFQGIYYLVMGIVGYVLLKDQQYFPKVLGGTASVDAMWKSDFEITHGVVDYVAIEIGFHLSNLVFLYCESRRNDTLELVLSSLVAIFLAVGAYIEGYAHLAVVLFFLHDLGDCLSFFTKVFVETNSFGAVLSTYSLLMPVWAYTRLYVFCYLLLPEAYEVLVANDQQQPQLFFLLALLGVHHLYWTVNLFVLGVMAITNPNVDVKKLAAEVPPTSLSCDGKKVQ